MSRAGYTGPDYRDPAQRPAAVRGLSERLALKAAEAVNTQRIFLPSYGQVPQIADTTKGSTE